MSSPSETSDPLTPQTSALRPANRSRARNVHLYGASDPTAVIGGLRLTSGVTNANFYSMVDILIIASAFFLRDEGGFKIEKDSNPLVPGKYYIVTPDSFSVNNEPWLLRTSSQAAGTRIEAFCQAVHSRDRRCVISGEEAADAIFDEWDGFEAAPIFPLAYERHWNDHNYGSWITIPSETGGPINSMQNGMLLRTDIYQLFNIYTLSINPDDNYKIVFFSRDSKNLAGNHLDQRFIDDPQRPVDQLLRWHFRQAVLANMRGAGEPVFEHDFPPGSDIVGDILSGPRAAERMEFEIFGRLADQVEIVSSDDT